MITKRKSTMFKMEAQPDVMASYIYDKTIADGKSQAEARGMVERATKGFVADPRRFYCPNGANEKLINTFAYSNHDTDVPVILCTYANGVGKTTSVLQIIANLTKFREDPKDSLVYNGWFDQGCFLNWKYPKTIWYCSTHTALKEKLGDNGDLIQMLAPGTYEKFKESKAYISRIEFKSGWTLRVFSFDQAASEFESANVGLIINDEPAPEAIWKAQKSRRRMGCITIHINTPLYAPPYLLEECVRNSDKGIKGYYYLEAAVYDACMRRGIRGHMKEYLIDDMVAQYDDLEREARALGKFMYFSTVIFPEYAGNNQLYDCYISPDRDGFFINDIFYKITERTILTKMVIDPKDGKSDAVIYAWKLPNGRIVIFDELPNDKEKAYWDQKVPFTPKDNVRAMYSKEVASSLIVNRRIMDKRFGWQTRSGKYISTNYSEIGFRLCAQAGLNLDFTFLKSFDSPNKELEIRYGHGIIRGCFALMPDGLPGLLIGSNCYHTRNGLNHYIRRNEVTKLSEERDKIEAPIVEKYKDHVDCVRYLVCDNDFVAPAAHSSNEVRQEPKLDSTDYL